MPHSYQHNPVHVLVFGVSASNLDAVVRYIQTHEAHHRKMSFEQEFIALLEKHGLAYDPR
jgi:hypothetical protein